MPSLYLGLGANLGNRLRNLQAGLRALAPAARTLVVSSLYETEPVGSVGQPPYWNAVARVETALTLSDLLALLKRVERQMGRRPGPRWGPRPLDLDILLADLVVQTPDLVVPHPRLAERPFVLVPLAELAADVVHPLLRRSIGELRAQAGEEGVRRLTGPEWLSARDLRSRR
ncbi:MAG: 2-amino-4-hydroxy-6-hydroxymethyldihydropteridine diphosphokinase [Chloroflexota bacterium]